MIGIKLPYARTFPESVTGAFLSKVGFLVDLTFSSGFRPIFDHIILYIFGYIILYYIIFGACGARRLGDSGDDSAPAELGDYTVDYTTIRRPRSPATLRLRWRFGARGARRLGDSGGRVGPFHMWGPFHTWGPFHMWGPFHKYGPFHESPKNAKKHTFGII